MSDSDKKVIDDIPGTDSGKKDDPVGSVFDSPRAGFEPVGGENVLNVRLDFLENKRMTFMDAVLFAAVERRGGVFSVAALTEDLGLSTNAVAKGLVRLAETVDNRGGGYVSVFAAAAAAVKAKEVDTEFSVVFDERTVRRYCFSF